MTARLGGHSYYFLYTRCLRQGEMSGPLEDQEFGHRGCWQSNVPGVKGLMGFSIPKSLAVHSDWHMLNMYLYIYVIYIYPLYFACIYVIMFFLSYMNSPLILIISHPKTTRLKAQGLEPR